MLLPVTSGADFGQVRVIAFGGIPAVTQQVDIHHAFSAVSDSQVFLVVDVVGTEARRLRLGDGNRSGHQPKDRINVHGVGNQHRFTQGAWLPAVYHHARLFVDFVGDRLIHDVEVGGGVHNEEHHTVELIAVLPQAARKGFLTVGLDVGGYHHVSIGANCSRQRLQAVLHVALKCRVSHISADYFGELVNRAAAAFKRFFGSFVWTVFPRRFDRHGFTGANLLARHFIGGVHVTRFDRTAHPVEGSLAEITFNQLVIQQNRPVGRGVKDCLVILSALKESGLRQVVINNQVTINSGRHGLIPYFGSLRKACWPCLRM